MLFVTGDCHGDFRRFSALRFPWQKLLTKERFLTFIVGMMSSSRE